MQSSCVYVYLGPLDLLHFRESIVENHYFREAAQRRAS